MGLDVAFDREQALKAGMEVKTSMIGTAEEIRQAEDAVKQGLEDPDYLRYLSEERTYIRVAGMQGWQEDGGGKSSVVVRAGYPPLTDWLRANGIEWTEA